MPAVSGLAFTGTERSCGFINPKPIRNIPYAASTPNAIDPTAAQTSMTKFNKSAIISILFTQGTGPSDTRPFKNRRAVFIGLLRFSQNFCRVDPGFYWQLEYP
jgi:hypothetical protein